MEWSNDLVFQLIDEYRKRPLLWDTSDNCYKIHSKKNDAWAEIATNMGTDISEVKKKINSLLASYRRERQKMTVKNELYLESYPSTWFAFHKFDFLTDIYTPRKRLNPLFHCEDPEEQQNIEGVMEMKLEVLEEDGNNRATPDFKHVMIKKRSPSESEYPPRKRKPTTDDDILETRSFEVLPRDDCSVYGEHIANEIRKLPHRAQNEVKHLINNIIYDAQMGMYDNPQASPRTSSQTSPTPPAYSSHKVKHLINNIIYDAQMEMHDNPQASPRTSSQTSPTPPAYSSHFEDSFSNENAHMMGNNGSIVKQEHLSD